MKPTVIDLSPIHNLGDGGISNTDLVDGNHTIVKCSMCKKKLCDAWVIQPSFKMKSKIVADCDYCGDKSYEVEVEGKFQLGVTDDSALVDIKHEFLDGSTPNMIYQKLKVKTKRLK